MASDVSIVIPTLNEESFIEDCLDSVQENISNCSEREFEVIIVDSYSEDATLEVVREHELECNITQTEKGILRARHTGIETAENEIIVSMDADSIYPDTYLKKVLEPFQNSNNTVLSYGPVLGRYKDEKPNIDFAIRVSLQYGLRTAGLHWISGSNRAFKKEAYYNAGGYDLSRDCESVSKVMYEEQFHFPLRMKKYGEVHFVREAKSRQSSRTVKQLLMLDEKEGGQDWSLISHYEHISGLKTQLTKPL